MVVAGLDANGALHQQPPLEAQLQAILNIVPAHARKPAALRNMSLSDKFLGGHPAYSAVADVHGVGCVGVPRNCGLERISSVRATRSYTRIGGFGGFYGAGRMFFRRVFRVYKPCWSCVLSDILHIATRDGDRSKWKRGAWRIGRACQ